MYTKETGNVSSNSDVFLVFLFYAIANLVVENISCRCFALLWRKEGTLFKYLHSINAWRANYLIT